MKIKIKELNDSIIYFYPRHSLKRTPDNWIYVSPVKFLGIFIGNILKIAKLNYKWSNYEPNNKRK